MKAAQLGRKAVLLGAAATLALLVGGGPTPVSPRWSGVLDDDEALEARAPTLLELTPGVQAAFLRESYAPGSRASFRVFHRARLVTMQVFRIGPERSISCGPNEILGTPVTQTLPLGTLRQGRLVTILVGDDWPSGLYFVRLSSVRQVGFAPFVVRPRSLGEHHVAVVMPTLTWQAYNLRDDDGNGVGNSWYAAWRVHAVRLARPYLNRGVPNNFNRYDLPFLRWLDVKGKRVDVLTDSDLDAMASGRRLAKAYNLVIFPGHHEYVTKREYDVVEQYRNLGGHLMFLSANNFFWKVTKRGRTIKRAKMWRELGRPEAALVGVEYRASDGGQRRGPWIVRGAPAGDWVFRDCNLPVGGAFSLGGIEIDQVASGSPRRIQVLASIPDLFGPGRTAQMTYYETAVGAEVFAAGSFRLVTLPLRPEVAQLLENLWNHMAQPRD